MLTRVFREGFMREITYEQRLKGRTGFWCTREADSLNKVNWGEHVAVLRES